MATVLVIDPATSVRETLRIVFEAEHDVRVAATLDDVLDASPPDLVVLGLPLHPRDDRAAGHALARWSPEVPLLLLHAPGDVALHEITAPTRTVDFLAKPFDAYTVRARVRALLGRQHAPRVAAEVVESQRKFLEFPFVSHAAAAMLRRALDVDVPVLLQGEPGTGAPAIARAVHALKGSGDLTVIDAGTLGDGECERQVARAGAGGTVFVANLDRAPSPIQHQILDAVQRQEAPPRIIAATRRDLGELVAAGYFLVELSHRLGVLTIPLAPLRERPEDIPALVETVTRELALRLRLGKIEYAPSALARLGDYLWFGNGAELEAVLWRTLAWHQPQRVQPEQLVFFSEDALRSVTGTVRRAPSPPPIASGDGLATLNLEVLLGELAHELRNPMVTIKTFAQHLDSVLADPEVRARFSVLTTDAVSRMDSLLETLLDFARFGPPVRQPIDVRAMLDRVLAEQADALVRRHVSVERNGTGGVTVEVDEAQVLFALRSLIRGLVQDLTPHAALKVRGLDAGVLELEVRTEASVAARLAAYVEPRGGAGAAETPPLAWALAAALLQRNAGVVSVRRGDDAATIIRVDWGRRAA